MNADAALNSTDFLESFDITSVPSIIGIVTMVVVILFLIWVHVELYFLNCIYSYYVEVWGGP